MTKRTPWLAAVIGLALGCAGPGLEPPKERSHAQGGAGGSAGTAQMGGVSGGQDNPAGGGGAEPAPPFEGMDASVPNEADDDAAVPAHSEGDGGATHLSHELVGPQYLGSVSNGAECAMSYPTRGHEPVASPGARFPLFLYFVGTQFVGDDASARHDSPAALAVTEAMARRGFVALSVSYDNGVLALISDHQNQLACLFDGDRPASLIARACALPNVDCDLGIAAWGHSQGAYVAHSAHDREPRVSAVWATGYGGDAGATLPVEGLRVVNGEADGDNGTAAKLTMITGMTADQCAGPDQCLREDGSGWIIVRKSELAQPEVSSADHCWFDRQSCDASLIVLEPNWIDPASDKPFALEQNADWLAATARR